MTGQPGRRRWTARVLAVLAIFGPGLIAANAGNDAGGILTYASAGAQFGYRTLFLMVLVTVASGSVVAYDEHCVGTPHTAGTASSAFTESGDEPGLVRNESTTTTEVSNVTYIVPAGTTAVRIDRAAPSCTLP